MKTEINIYVLLAILLIHWFADFVLQTDKQAKGKSKNWSDLLSHTLTYSVCWLVMLLFLPLQETLAFIGTTFICHTITDYFTSRLNSKLWAGQKVHYFFVSVGFDQILHYVQLLITFQILSN